MFKKFDTTSQEVLSNPLIFEYKNWKGETSMRTVIPSEIWYGHTDYHTNDQWMLKAWDVDKEDTRDFVVKDIISFRSKQKNDFY